MSMIGASIGSCTIVELLGAGGMGEVYRAHDTALNRDVAIKVLPETLAGDPDRLARFHREAEALAALNHPNIAHVYGLEKSGGRPAIVMELVEGPTLADRIKAGPIAVEEALPIARQIAEAIEAAHERGIVHRDLKPANIKVRDDGTVKVLDFGLAKAFDPPGAPSVEAMNSPTLTNRATQMGVILGTAAYMAPEQAKGRPVDKRVDVWAFGVVLFEMLTGRRPFDGSDVSEVMASVLKIDPDWSALPATTPRAIERLVRRCLVKSQQNRLHDISDARLEIDDAATEPPGTPVDSGRSLPAFWWRAMLMVVAAIVLTSVVVWGLWPTAEARPVRRLTITQPDDQPADPWLQSPVLALSPDGTQAAYRVLVDGRGALVARSLDKLESVVLYQGGVYSPFFSPDSAWVGFYDQDAGTMRRVSVTGGPAIKVCDVGAPRLRGATWGEDDTIIFGTSTSSGLWKVPVGGGTPEPLTTLDESRGETNHSYPELLPGGHVLLLAIERPGPTQIVALRLDTLEQQLLVSGGNHPRYAQSGHLVYSFRDALLAVTFDLDRLAVTGTPNAVLTGVSATNNGAANAAMSRDGTLLYLTETTGSRRTLVWIDRKDGREEQLDLEPRAYVYPRLSPDGTRVALDVRDGEDDIWIWDLEKKRMTQLTFDPGVDRVPIWSLDGQRVFFSSTRSGGLGNLFWQAADGTGVAHRLSDSPNVQFPTAFTLDGSLLYSEAPVVSPPFDVSVVSTTGESPPTSLLHMPNDEKNAVLSPDGKWMAYESNESDRYEVYVRPFPDVEAGRWQISPRGGTRPLWSPTRLELFYLDSTLRVMAVPVHLGETFSYGNNAQPVVDGPYLAPNVYRTYDVSADGERFLMIKNAGTEGEAAARSQIIVVLNWFEELKRLVPVK